MTINFTQLIFCKKNALTKDECQFLMAEHSRLQDNDMLENCPDANTGILTPSSFKRGILEYGTEAWNLVFKVNETLINEYMDYLDTFKMFHIPYLRNSMMFSHMYRLLKYEVGAKIHPHSDHDPHVYGSATFNLNDDYTGGDFVFWNGKHRLKLEAGEGMIWPADYFWVHEVEPIKTGVRYSTNSFLLNIPQPLRSELNNVIANESNNPDYQNYIKTHQYQINQII